MDFSKYYFESLIVHNDCTPFCIHKGTLISIERWILIGDGILTSFIWVVKYSKAKFPIGFMGSKIVDWKLGLGKKFVGWKKIQFSQCDFSLLRVKIQKYLNYQLRN